MLFLECPSCGYGLWVPVFTHKQCPLGVQVKDPMRSIGIPSNGCCMRIQGTLGISTRAYCHIGEEQQKTVVSWKRDGQNEWFRAQADILCSFMQKLVIGKG